MRTWAAAVAVAAGLLVVASGGAETIIATPISNDPYTNTNGDGQHKTQLEPDSFAFGNTIVALSQSGRYINGGGASNLVWASSQNAGKTWRTAGMPGGTINEGGVWPRISDPSVAYDPQDDVWLILGLGIDAGGSGHILLVDRSTDSGVTWSNPVNAGESGGSFWDKTWITCDTWASSPHYGNCYIEFDDNGAGNQVEMVTSTDGGLTWGPVRSAGCSSGLGGQPVAQPNGNVIVPYSANGGAEYTVRSTDGGNTWGGCTLIASVTEHNVAGSMRTFSLPSAEVAGDGRVYVAWQDCRFRSGCPGNDIVYSSSMDGLTWSAVTRIPIDPTTSGADHFLPGIAVDKNTSGSGTHLAVGYYYFPVSSCSSSTCDLTVGFVSSLDGGATWTTGRAVTPPMRVGWIANTNQGRMVGDYISTSFTGDGKAHPVFSWAKPLDNGASCSHTTVCRQRLSTASFDITAPPLKPRAKSETGPVYLPRTQKRPARLPTAN
ncbi:MAG TPA: sialidase family protein [Gaiellaceae bacterium]|nr:sialidase family protein [Gaiellaceae bacterium]